MNIPMKEQLIFQCNQLLVKISCRNAWSRRGDNRPSQQNYGMLAAKEQHDK